MTDKQLLSVMEKCGHFLYHRRGYSLKQHYILKLLNTNGKMTQSQLQEYISVKAGTISEIVSKLEKNGCITKQKDESDKRKTNLEITEAGKRLYEEKAEIERNQLGMLFTALTEDEKKTAILLLTKLLEDWKSKFENEAFFWHNKGKGE